MDTDVEFYLKNITMFFSDFWTSGNKDLKIEIEPRAVQSGTWFTATWLTTDGNKRHVTAQRLRLILERIIKQYLEDEYAEKNKTMSGM